MLNVWISGEQNRGGRRYLGFVNFFIIVRLFHRYPHPCAAAPDFWTAG
jgi:hypothetical protein